MKEGYIRIAAVLGVKDEAELIETTVTHLRDIGVDTIIACDMGSTDGTLAVLEQYSSGDDFLILQLNEQTTTEEWSRASLELARKANVDWVVFVDADEYLLPATGQLRDCEALVDADVLVIDAFNVPVGPRGPLMPNRLDPDNYDEVTLIVDGFPASRSYFLENPTAPLIRMMWPPKVMVRPELIVRMTDGAHSVVPVEGASLRSVRPADLLIAHLPFSTRSRFARKIDNIRRVFEIHGEYMGPDLGWHWRRWLDLADRGRLGEEFDRNVFDAEMIAMLRVDGAVNTARQVFQDRMNAAREAELVSLRNDLASRDAALSNRDAQLANRDAELAMRDAALSKLDTQLAMRDAEIVSLRGIVDRASARADALLGSWQYNFKRLASSKLYRKGHYKEDYRIIRSSGLFDAEYYLRSYRDVCDARLDPILHFVFDGASELRNPERRVRHGWLSGEESRRPHCLRESLCSLFDLRPEGG